MVFSQKTDDMVLFHASISRNCRTLTYPYFSLKTNFEKKGPGISKFWSAISMIHPELIIPPLMSLIGFQEMDTLGNFSIPFAAPKLFFSKWCTSPNLEPSNETFCKIWRKSNDQETNKVPRTLYHLSTPGHISIFSKALK